MNRSVHVSLQGLPFNYLHYVHEVQNVLVKYILNQRPVNTVTPRGAVALP